MALVLTSFNLIYGARKNEDGTPDADGIEFHLTMNLGRLAIQLICLLPNPYTPKVRFKPVILYWRDIVVDITKPSVVLPRVARDIVWPTPGHLTDETFLLFRERWNAQYLAEGQLAMLRATVKGDSTK
jgi:hypothetical protein